MSNYNQQKFRREGAVGPNLGLGAVPPAPVRTAPQQNIPMHRSKRALKLSTPICPYCKLNLPPSKCLNWGLLVHLTFLRWHSSDWCRSDTLLEVRMESSLPLTYVLGFQSGRLLTCWNYRTIFLSPYQGRI